MELFRLICLFIYYCGRWWNTFYLLRPKYSVTGPSHIQSLSFDREFCMRFDFICVTVASFLLILIVVSIHHLPQFTLLIATANFCCHRQWISLQRTDAIVTRAPEPNWMYLLSLSQRTVLRNWSNRLWTDQSTGTLLPTDELTPSTITWPATAIHNNTNASLQTVDDK